MITLFTTHCPKCRMLEKKMQQKGIEYTETEKLDELIRAGYSSAPMIKTDEGEYLNFKEAWDWVNKK